MLLVVLEEKSPPSFFFYFVSNSFRKVLEAKTKSNTEADFFSLQSKFDKENSLKKKKKSERNSKKLYKAYKGSRQSLLKTSTRSLLCMDCIWEYLTI